jgi:hypothetical protein
MVQTDTINVARDILTSVGISAEQLSAEFLFGAVVSSVLLFVVLYKDYARVYVGLLTIQLAALLEFHGSITSWAFFQFEVFRSVTKFAARSIQTLKHSKHTNTQGHSSTHARTHPHAPARTRTHPHAPARTRTHPHARTHACTLIFRILLLHC